MTSTPVPSTATVTPPAFSEPRCAAASMPRARPLMTMTPARASSSASCSATASPYGDGRREPTIAARGPSGGGHLPFVLSSGRGILEPETEGLEHMLLADLVGCGQVGRRARHAPRAMEPACAEATLRRPPLEGSSRGGRQRRQLAQPRRLQLRVETSLPLELPAPRPDDALADF